MEAKERMQKYRVRRRKAGLRQISQIQVDKILTVARERVGEAIGRLDNATLLQVDRSLAVFVGIA